MKWDWWDCKHDHEFDVEGEEAYESWGLRVEVDKDWEDFL